MPDVPPEVVYCYVTFTIPNGEERIVRHAYMTTDHENAAQQAFASIGNGQNAKIRNIETWSGEPRRWSPSFEVKELG